MGRGTPWVLMASLPPSLRSLRCYLFVPVSEIFRNSERPNDKRMIYKPESSVNVVLNRPRHFRNFQVFHPSKRGWHVSV